MTDGLASTVSMLQILGARIKENITDYYPHLASNDVQVRGRPYGGHGTAKTFRFQVRSHVRGEEACIFVKFSPVTATLNWGLTEYEILRFLHPRMRLVEPRCSVARPLDYYDDLDALVIEQVKGVPFRNLFLRQNSRIRRGSSGLHMAISDCGRWLKTFHGLTYNGEQPFDIEALVESIDTELIGLCGYGFSADVQQKTMALIERLLPLGQLSLPVAACHHDFTPGHAFISHEGVSVIDIHGSTGHPIYEDIGYWLSSMATVNAFPWYPFFDYANANGLSGERFLDGYFCSNKLRIRESVLLSYLFKLRSLVQRFHEQRERATVAIHPVVAAVFTRVRLVKLFSHQILGTLSAVGRECTSLRL